MRSFLDLPRYEPKRVEVDGVRNYETPLGFCKSVTAILDATTDKSGIEEWRENLGEEAADRHVRISKYRGNSTHDSIDKFCATGAEPSFSFLTTPYWNSFKLFAPRLRETIFSEGAVWHPDGVAGTLDRLGYMDDSGLQPDLLDWKTADKWDPKSPLIKMKSYTYRMQAAVYVKCANYTYREYGLDIKRAVVAVFLPDTKPVLLPVEEKAIDVLYKQYILRVNKAYYPKAARKPKNLKTIAL